MSGGETANIAKKAEIISKLMFDEFLWEESGSRNQSWPCCANKVHGGRKTHPTDCVYYYDEPYRKVRTYINVDVKSFASASISKGAIEAALVSLAQAIECANQSQDWRDLYIHDGYSYEVCGMLFIYNHDGEYPAGKFAQEMDKIKIEKLKIPQGQRIVVYGPDEINWLNNVRYDIRALRGGTPARIPARARCKFFYPNLVRSKNVQPIRAKAATIEMLCSPWIIMQHGEIGQRSAGYVIYYRGKGVCEDEFLYLIDYLMHYQMLQAGVSVLIRLYNTDELAASFFLKAKQRYLDSYGQSDDLKELLDGVVVEGMTDIVTKFSSIEVGMA